MVGMKTFAVTLFAFFVAGEVLQVINAQTNPPCTPEGQTCSKIACCTGLSCVNGTCQAATTTSSTKAPTTKAPTTKAPTTKAPTTKAPTTKAPTTKAPTTKAPTTKAPTTKAPTTKAPTTKAPTTKAPTTKAPTTATTTPKCLAKNTPCEYADDCCSGWCNATSTTYYGKCQNCDSNIKNEINRIMRLRTEGPACSRPDADCFTNEEKKRMIRQLVQRCADLFYQACCNDSRCKNYYNRNFDEGACSKKDCVDLSGTCKNDTECCSGKCRNNTCQIVPCPVDSPYFYDGKCHECLFYYYFDGKCHDCYQDHYFDGKCHDCTRGQYFDGECHDCTQDHYFDGKCHDCTQGSGLYFDGECHDCTQDHFHNGECDPCAHYGEACRGSYCCDPDEECYYPCDWLPIYSGWCRPYCQTNCEWPRCTEVVPGSSSK